MAGELKIFLYKTMSQDQLIAQIYLELSQLRQEIKPAPRKEFWLPTADATKELQCQGIKRSEELRELVRLDVLPVDGTHVRNVADSPGKARYEFNIEPCVTAIAQWKSLHPQDRQSIIESRQVA